MNIAVVGTDEIGLSTAILLAYLNHFVVLVDDNQTKIDLLRNNSLHFYEPHLNEALKIANNSLYFTTNLTQAIECADVVYYTSDQGYSKREVCEIFQESLKEKFRILVNKCPCAVGTTAQMEAMVREKNSNFSIAYELPNVNIGSVVTDTFYPNKLVVGSKDMFTTDHIKNLYKPLLDMEVIIPTFIQRPHRPTAQPIWTTIESAELAYHSERVFSGIKSSLLNEINNFAAHCNAQTGEVLRILKMDSTDTFQVKHGLGWSARECGDSFRTLSEMASKNKIDVPIIESALRSNYSQRDLLVGKISSVLRGLAGRTITILGLTYKPFTDDITDSPALDIIQLLAANNAHIKIHDPVASFKVKMKLPDIPMELCETPWSAFQNADAVILCTEWPEYFELDWFKLAQVMKSPIVVDARNCLSPQEFTNMGIHLINF